MSRLKRITSVMLTAAILLSVLSSGFAAFGTPEEAPAFVYGEVTLNQGLAVTTYATEVTRVAAAANSFVNGTKIVKATPSGIPETDGFYANAAYASETPVATTVSITFPSGVLPDSTPTLTASGGTNLRMSAAVKSGQTYTWTVLEGEANAGDQLVFTISYLYLGNSYTVYEYSYVENITTAPGFVYRRRAQAAFGGTTGRFSYVLRYLGVNLYGSISNTNNGIGYVNWSSSGTGGASGDGFTTDTSQFAVRSSGGNKAVLNAFKDGGNSKTYNAGYGNDGNRPTATIYMDKSVHQTLADLNLRVNLFMHGDKEDFNKGWLESTYIKAGRHASTDGDGSGPNDEGDKALLGFSAPGDVDTHRLVNKGDNFTVNFTGTGPSTSTEYTVTTRARGNYDWTLISQLSVLFNIQVYDKGSLRDLIKNIKSGAAGKGANPQSWYYVNDGSWTAFLAAYNEANFQLKKPNTNQSSIDEAKTNLQSAYNNLNPKQVTYSVNYFINGTNTAVKPTVSATGNYIGYSLSTTYALIDGYELTNPSVVSIRKTITETDFVITYYYSPLKYTINFDSNEGSSVSPIKADYNSSVSKPADPTKTHYDFTGWYYDADLEEPVSSWPILMPLNGATLYAGWSLAQASINFEAGGAPAINPLKALPGEFVSQPNDPAYQDYIFAGWYENADFTTRVQWPVEMPYGGKTVYVKWLYGKNTINFDSNGGQAVAAITQAEGTAVSEPAAPTRVGYNFAGWYYDNETFENAVDWNSLTMPGNGLLLYAKWNPKTISIIFNSAGGTAVETITAEVGSQISAPANPVRYGYLFSEWRQGSTPFNFSTMPASDNNITLTARWTTNASYAEVKIELFREVYGELVPVTEARAGEELVVRVSPRTNFYTATTSYAIMYDSTFFEILEGEEGAVALNSGNPFAVQTGATVTSAANGAPGSWPTSFTDAEKAGMSWLQITLEPTGAAMTNGRSRQMNSTAHMFEFKVKIRDSATGSGRMYMDNRWTRTKANNKGTTYFSKVNSASALIETADQYTVVPELLEADKTIILDDSPLPVSTISFNSDGGTPVSSKTGVVGTAVPENTVIPTKHGYDFAGWLPEYPEFYPTESVELTAQWTPTVYYAAFYIDGELVGDVVPIPYKSVITPPEYTPPEGYGYYNWSVPVEMPAENRNFYSTIYAETYKAVFYLNGEIYREVPTVYNNVVAVPNYTPNPGEDFSGWSDVDQYMPAHDTAYYATTSAALRTAYFYIDGVEYTKIPVPVGGEIPIPDYTPAIGKAFTTWTGIPSEMPDSDQYYYAYTTDIVYTFRFYLDGNLKGTRQGVYGAPLVAPPVSGLPAGYTSDGWDNPSTIPAESTDYYATSYQQPYNMEFFINGELFATTTAVLRGAITKPEYTVPEGYTFSGWTTPATLQSASDKKYYATLTPNSYVASFYVDNVFYHAVEVSFGSEIPVPEYTGEIPAGYSFSGWNADEFMPADNQRYDATINPILYVAKFYVDGKLEFEVPTYCGEEIVVPVFTPEAGYSVTDWDPVPGVMGAGNMNFNATTYVSSFTFTYVVDGVETDVLYSTGSIIVRPAEPEKEGYIFVKWSPEIPYQMPNSNLRVEAIFREKVRLVEREGSTTVIDEEFIYGLKPRMSFDDFEDNFVEIIGDGYLDYSDIFATYMGTGMEVYLYDEITDELVATFVIIIFGDVDGNGTITTRDADLIRTQGVTTTAFNEYQRMAADLNIDGRVTAADADILKTVCSGKRSIDQQYGEAY